MPTQEYSKKKKSRLNKRLQRSSFSAKPSGATGRTGEEATRHLIKGKKKGSGREGGGRAGAGWPNKFPKKRNEGVVLAVKGKSTDGAGAPKKDLRKNREKQKDNTDEESGSIIRGKKQRETVWVAGEGKMSTNFVTIQVTFSQRRKKKI